MMSYKRFLKRREPKDTQKRDFELYAFFQQQCRHEQYTLWIRFGVMVASQGALAGLYVEYFGGNDPAKSLFVAIAGLVFSVLFRILQGRTMQWINHYIGYLHELEPRALGIYEMNRKARRGDIRSTRKMATLTSALIIVAWAMLTVSALVPFIREASEFIT